MSLALNDLNTRRARDTLTGNSLVKFSKAFVSQPAAALAPLAQHAGFSRAGEALRTGRMDTLADAVGRDAIARLADEGAALVNRKLDALFGKWGERLKAVDRSDPPPSGAVMLVLGDVPFMVGTLAHQSLARSHEYRWAVHERLLRTPARQFVGPGDESLTLEGYLLPHYTGGGEMLAGLRELAEQGEAHILLDHFGEVYGRYVIESITETGTELDMTGQARRIEFSIALAAYGVDTRTPIVTVGEIEPLPMDEDIT